MSILSLQNTSLSFVNRNTFPMPENMMASLSGAKSPPRETVDSLKPGAPFPLILQPPETKLAQSSDSPIEAVFKGAAWLVFSFVGWAVDSASKPVRGAGRQKKTPIPAPSGFGKPNPAQTAPKDKDKGLTCKLDATVEQTFSRSTGINHIQATAKVTGTGSRTVHPVQTGVKAEIISATGRSLTPSLESIQSGPSAQVIVRHNEQSSIDNDNPARYGLKAHGACQFSNGTILSPQAGKPASSGKRFPDLSVLKTSHAFLKPPSLQELRFIAASTLRLSARLL